MTSSTFGHWSVADAVAKTRETVHNLEVAVGSMEAISGFTAEVEARLKALGLGVGGVAAAHEDAEALLWKYRTIAQETQAFQTRLAVMWSDPVA